MVTLLLLASASLCWPGPRFRAHPEAGPGRRLIAFARSRAPGAMSLTVATIGAAALAGALAGPAGLIAMSAVLGTGVLLGRRALSDRQ